MSFLLPPELVFQPPRWSPFPGAYHEVETFLALHPDLMPLLKNKILQAEYYLKRANEGMGK